MPYDRSAFITRTPVESVAFDFACDATQFIADAIFTPKPVDKALKKVYQMDGSKLRIPSTKKGTNAEPNLIDEQLFATDITLDEYKVAKDVNPRDVRDADMPALLGEARAAKICTLGLLLEREQIAASLVTTTGNYPAALTSAIASGSRWNEANGDPEADVITANSALVDACGRRANAMAIGDITLDKIRLSPYFRSRTQYTQAGPVPVELVKAYFGVQHLFVGSARYDSALEGAAASRAGFWSDYALLYVYNPSPDLEAVSYGHMYLEKAPFWSTTQMDTKREGPAGAMRRVTVGSEYKMAAGFVVSSSDSDFSAGYLFRTVVA